MEKTGENKAKEREVMIKGITEENFVELKYLRLKGLTNTQRTSDIINTIKCRLYSDIISCERTQKIYHLSDICLYLKYFLSDIFRKLLLNICFRSVKLTIRTIGKYVLLKPLEEEKKKLRK